MLSNTIYAFSDANNTNHGAYSELSIFYTIAVLFLSRYQQQNNRDKCDQDKKGHKGRKMSDG
jgi:hypothetical protein